MVGSFAVFGVGCWAVSVAGSFAAFLAGGGAELVAGRFAANLAGGGAETAAGRFAANLAGGGAECLTEVFRTEIGGALGATDAFPNGFGVGCGVDFEAGFLYVTCCQPFWESCVSFVSTGIKVSL